jgi:UMF1 family MFS transporter
MEVSMSNTKNPQQSNAWVLFPLGISAFWGTIVQAILPLYFEQVTTDNFSSLVAKAYWEYTIALALLHVAVLAPLLGSYVDHGHDRKRLLVITNVIGILATGCMVFINAGDWLLALVLYLIAAVSGGTSLSLFASLLSHLVKKDEFDKISLRAYLNEFIGMGATLAISLILILLILPDTNWGTRLSFLLAAFWWSVVSFLSLRHFPDTPSPIRAKQTSANSSKSKPNDDSILKTIKKARQPRQLLLFLLAIGLSSGGIITITQMATSIGSEIGLGIPELFVGLLLSHLAGGLFIWILLRSGMKIDAKRSIITGLVIYTVASACAYFMFNKWIFWLLAIVTGITQGMVLPLSRSFFARMVPRERSGEYFGLYYGALNLPVIVGPIILAQSGLLFGSVRLSSLSVVLVFVLARFVFTFVDDEAAEESKGKKESASTAEKEAASNSKNAGREAA